jgi:hypothetical protein
MKTDPTRRQFLKASVAGALGATLVGGKARAAVPNLKGRLAVCSWSLEPTSADDLMKKLAETGILRTQIALDPIRVNEGGAWTGSCRTPPGPRTGRTSRPTGTSRRSWG